MDSNTVGQIKSLLEEFRSGMESVKRLTPTRKDQPDVQKSFSLLEQAFGLFQSAVNVELGKISSRLTTVEDRQENLDQYSRRNCLLFRGIHGSGDGAEDEKGCLELVMDVIKNKLQLNLSEEVVERCHRLGVKRNPDHVRPIIVKFYSYRYRNQVFGSKKLLKGTRITICEFLTKNRMAVLNKARDVHGKEKCWTSDGKVIIKLVVNNRERKVVATKLEHVPQSGSEPQPSAPPPEPAGTSGKAKPPAAKKTNTVTPRELLRLRN
ncbi:uncharacterized protein LOC113471878 [Diaphorina citri]|uniref:Uncharacterized protein LOC113471878 n=1 Tax=Diaphorina citri TaxID=121845 RepID=A0A3Q0JJZ2_DIACI|nr:uncharacterized protein LOC113471878 [Diaphorina citri]